MMQWYGFAGFVFFRDSTGQAQVPPSKNWSLALPDPEIMLYIYIAAGLGQVEESRCIALRTSHHLTLSHPDQQVSLPFTFTSYGAGFGISEKETGNQNNAKGSQSKSKEAGGINRQSCALLSVFDLGQCQAYS